MIESSRGERRGFWKREWLGAHTCGRVRFAILSLPFAGNPPRLKPSLLTPHQRTILALRGGDGTYRRREMASKAARATGNGKANSCVIRATSVEQRRLAEYR